MFPEDSAFQPGLLWAAVKLPAVPALGLVFWTAAEAALLRGGEGLGVSAPLSKLPRAIARSSRPHAFLSQIPCGL